ncbi:HD domain-containing phosphohydrolase [Deinococcus pimensis]|uniref:HD domain-containing phosphohydrolase n=1 Tax=Deinococcus pimensis TaxID=309888 RepID=UPI0004B83B3D|nr:HD domain-containing phosphohydrolase [Deinococcus pimensis]
MTPGHRLSLTADQLLRAQHQVTRTLVRGAASAEVLRLVLESAVHALGANCASLGVVDSPESRLLRHVLSVPGEDHATCDLPLEPGTPSTDAVLTGAPVYLDGRDRERQYPHLAAHLPPHAGSAAALPLVTGERVLGVIGLTWDHDHAPSDAERAFMEHFAAQCAQTLERVELHEARQRHEARLHKLLEFSTDVLLVLDASGRATYLSPSVTLTLGYGDDLAGMSLADVVHPDDLADLTDRFRASIAAPTLPLRATFRVRHREGRWVVLEMIGRNLLHDEDVRGFVCNARDVTASVQAVEEVRRREREERALTRRYRELLDLVTALDSETDPDELLVAVLERTLAVTDYARGFYHDVRGGVSTLRFARGERIEEALSVLPAVIDLRALGRSGEAMLRHETFFARADEPLLDPPEPLPRRFWRAFCAFPVVVAGELVGTFVFLAGDEDEVGEEHRQLMRALADHVNVLLERRWHLRQLDASREETLHAIGLALEYRDGETSGHTARVVRLTERLATALRLPDADQDALRWGAYLHDTGKIATPDAILRKPGPLDAHEWEVMRRHPLVGHEMLSRVPSLPPATLAVVLHHHERWDGGGYPHGLAGEDIPLPARLFAVVDVYDALTSERPYKRAWTHAEAAAQLRREAGRLLDPAVVDVFLRVLEDGDAGPGAS